jgi:SAM-dependent methyltransferase
MIGVELLDDPRADPALVRRALADVALTNRLFGGTRAVIAALEPHFHAAPNQPWTLLDVGTGVGDVPLAAAKAARRYGIDLRLVGVERIAAAARLAQSQGLATVLADGGTLPFAPRSVDVVIASQVLHHLPRAMAARWIAAFDCIARRAVVLADLHRSSVAMAAWWLASFPLRLHPVTRHDGVVSLRRGFTRAEFEALCRAAGVRATVRYRPIARVVADWVPRQSQEGR